MRLPWHGRSPALGRAARAHPRARGGGRPWLAAALLLALAGLSLRAGAALLPAQLGPSLRLRVVGAANTEAAQQVKLAVRDAVLQAIAPALLRARSAAQAEALVRARLGAVTRLARAVAGRFGEGVRVRLGPVPFPRERLGWLAFPPGRYPALAIYLGAARGHNWWTVLFPPLALVRLGPRLAIVGPAQPLGPTARAALGAWLDGAVGVRGPGGWIGTRVQIRFALWELLQALARQWPHWWRP